MKHTHDAVVHSHEHAHVVHYLRIQDHAHPAGARSFAVIGQSSGAAIAMTCPNGITRRITARRNVPDALPPPRHRQHRCRARPGQLSPRRHRRRPFPGDLDNPYPGEGPGLPSPAMAWMLPRRACAGEARMRGSNPDCRHDCAGGKVEACTCSRHSWYPRSCATRASTSGTASSAGSTARSTHRSDSAAQ